MNGKYTVCVLLGCVFLRSSLATNIHDEVDYVIKRMVQIEQENARLVNRMTQMEQEDERLVNRMTQMEQEDERLVNRMTQMEQENARLVNRMTQMEQEDERLVNRITQMEQEDERLVNRMTQMELEDERLVNRMTQVEQKNLRLVNRMTQVEQENVRLVYRMTQVEQENVRLVYEMAQVERKNEHLKSRTRDAEEENERGLDRQLVTENEELLDVIEKQEKLDINLSNGTVPLGNKRRRSFPAVPYAFTAVLDHEVEHAGIDQIVVFNRILLNDGNAYNKNIGVFTVPTDGVYLFYLAFASGYDPHRVWMHIVVDGVGKVGGVADTLQPGHDIQGTNLVMLHLHQGDSVWVSTFAYPDVQIFGSALFTTFSGILLYQY